MSYRVSRKALQVTGLAGLLAGAVALSGCSALGSRALVDNSVTGSTSGAVVQSSISQPLPSTLAPRTTRVAEGRYVPPSDIGGNGRNSHPAPAMVVGQGSGGAIRSQDLPVINSSTPGNLNQMSAQPSIASATPTPVQLASKPSTPLPSSLPASGGNVIQAPSNAYVHVIESGESLYTIARRYDVTAQAIVQANGLASPDKIYVGQRVVIPGRADLLGNKPAPPAAPSIAPSAEPVRVASLSAEAATPLPGRASGNISPGSAPIQQAAKPQPLQQPTVEPTLSGADKFRWPVSGRVIVDFANSKGTGINIEAPEGAAIRAAENGQVIYVGNGVEGYGNLILVRHPNGYVSAYAHLKDARVAKGDVISRGDQIGTAGMTGSVTRPQLHFELRKGATPVDPVPLLAS